MFRKLSLLFSNRQITHGDIMKWALIISALVVLSEFSFAAKYPDEIKYDPETSLLISGKNQVKGLYNESKLDSMFLEFDSDNWGDDVERATDRDEYVLATLRYEDKVFDSVAVQFKGYTSQSGVRNPYGRKSFDIKLDEFKSGQDIGGYSTFNLNNAYEDKSLMREVVFAHFCRQHIPAVKANFINLYINGEFHGVYNNTQQQNKDFIREWFWSTNGSRFRADYKGRGFIFGTGYSTLNYLGNNQSEYEEAYTLKASDMNDPWGDLMNVTKVLDDVTESNLQDLWDVLDIDAALWFLGHEIAFMDEDSYVFKGGMDYSIYIDDLTGRLTPLEIDGNSAFLENAMGENLSRWEPDVRSDDSQFPLLYKLMKIDEVRGRHYAHFRTILKEYFLEYDYEKLMDDYFNLIKDDVERDQVLRNSFGYDVDDVRDGVEDLKRIMKRRGDFLQGVDELAAEGPTISGVEFTSNSGSMTPPNEREEITVFADVESDDGVEEVNLFYSTGLTGNFQKVAMTQSDGKYRANISGQDEGTYIRFYIEAVADNNYKSRSYNPPGAEHDVYMVQVNFKSVTTSSVVINEFMADNESTVQDEQGEYEDWVELYNNSDEDVSLNGYHLSDNSLDLDKWQLPNITIAANSYVTIWLDKDLDQGDLHADVKLSSGGEELVLSDGDLNIVDIVSFGAQQPDVSVGRYPNGTGEFTTMTPTYGGKNIGDGSEISSSSEEMSSSSESFSSSSDAFSSSDDRNSSRGEESSSSDEEWSSSEEQPSLSSSSNEDGKNSSSSEDITPIHNNPEQLNATIDHGVLDIFNPSGNGYRIQILDVSGKVVFNMNAINRMEQRVYLRDYVKQHGYYFVSIYQDGVRSTLSYFNY